MANDEKYLNKAEDIRSPAVAGLKNYRLHTELRTKNAGLKRHDSVRLSLSMHVGFLVFGNYDFTS
ncbi:MAG: hypothetical protein CMQ45_03980 [Gammaproteobacteria bacterium]|nr:hypothetical protein [Gammaproteobacteria bacterium]